MKPLPSLVLVHALFWCVCALPASHSNVERDPGAPLGSGLNGELVQQDADGLLFMRAVGSALASAPLVNRRQMEGGDVVEMDPAVGAVAQGDGAVQTVVESTVDDGNGNDEDGDANRDEDGKSDEENSDLQPPAQATPSLSDKENADLPPPLSVELVEQDAEGGGVAEMDRVVEVGVQGDGAVQAVVESTIDDGNGNDEDWNYEVWNDEDWNNEDWNDEDWNYEVWNDEDRNDEDWNDEGGDANSDPDDKSDEDDSDLPPPSQPTPNELPLWTPDVIATTLILIPVVLAITIIIILFLFLLLHCCTPRKIAHVTHSTYTRQYLGRQPGGNDAPMDPEGMLAAANVPEITPPPPSAAAPSSSSAQPETTRPGGSSPSSALYIPHYPRRHFDPTDLDGTVAPTKWHHGLLDLGGGVSPRPGSFFRTFIPSSLRSDAESPPGNKDPTAHNLREATRRLEDATTVHLEGPSASLATGLQDSSYGRETLRDRRKGMRDSWLDSIFTDRAPGTENLAILKQRDGVLCGASIGGAIDPNTIVIDSTSTSTSTSTSSAPRKPIAAIHTATDNIKSEKQPLRTYRVAEYSSTGSSTGYEASQSDLSDGREKENVSPPPPPPPVKIQFQAVPSGQVVGLFAVKGDVDGEQQEPEQGLAVASLDGPADVHERLKERDVKEEDGMEGEEPESESELAMASLDGAADVYEPQMGEGGVKEVEGEETKLKEEESDVEAEEKDVEVEEKKVKAKEEERESLWEESEQGGVLLCDDVQL